MATCVWNNCVSPPPVASCNYDCYEIDEEDVNNLKIALQVIQTSHSLGQGLASDQYTLSRLLFKANNQQRQWRWYQMLKRIQKCLNRLQANHVTKFTEDAVCCCQINRSETESTIHLPSRQMLEYILVKLMGQAKLCAYILNMAESVFIFVVQNISSGQFLAHNTIYATIVSRVWVMMRIMIRDIISWYSTLRPWTDRLKGTSMQWMAADEVLPQSLHDWLRADYDLAKYTTAIEQTSKKKGSSFLDKMFAATLTTLDATVTESLTNGLQNTKEVVMTTAVDPSLDLGEPISTEEATEKRSKVNLKRKRSELGCQQEPKTKRSRPDVENPTPVEQERRLADGFSTAHSGYSRQESGVSYKLKQDGGSDARKTTKRKHPKVAPKHLKCGLQEGKGMQQEGYSEGRMIDEAISYDDMVVATKRDWKKNLKKNFKKKLGKLTKVPTGKGVMMTAVSRKDLSMEEIHLQGDGVKVGTALPVSSETSHPEMMQRLKKKSKIKKEATTFVKSEHEGENANGERKHKGQEGGSEKEKMGNKKDKMTKDKARRDSKTGNGTSLKESGKKPKRFKKLQSVSSIVCELGELSRGAPTRMRSIQKSEMDDIFALLE